jgi:hypothetical protein
MCAAMGFVKGSALIWMMEGDDDARVTPKSVHAIIAMSLAIETRCFITRCVRRASA